PPFHRGGHATMPGEIRRAGPLGRPLVRHQQIAHVVHQRGDRDGVDRVQPDLEGWLDIVEDLGRGNAPGRDVPGAHAPLSNSRPAAVSSLGARSRRGPLLMDNSSSGRLEVSPFCDSPAYGTGHIVGVRSRTFPAYGTVLNEYRAAGSRI